MRTLLLVTVLLSVLLPVFSDYSSSKKKQNTIEFRPRQTKCHVNEDCVSGYECRHQRCERTCAIDTDCNIYFNQRCIDTICQKVSTTCKVPEDCPVGFVCDTVKFDTGVRKKKCLKSCTVNSDCLQVYGHFCSKEICRPVGQCHDDEDCPTPFVCAQTGSKGISATKIVHKCFKFCAAQGDCDILQGYLCINNICRNIRDECHSNSDCFVPGYSCRRYRRKGSKFCFKNCFTSADCSTQTGSRCFQGLCRAMQCSPNENSCGAGTLCREITSDPPFFMCVTTCAVDADCNAIDSCQSKVCQPRRWTHFPGFRYPDTFKKHRDATAKEKSDPHSTDSKKSDLHSTGFKKSGPPFHA